MASFFNNSNNISKTKEVLGLKRKLFSLAICLFLFIGLFSVLVINVQAPVGDGIVEVDVPPRGTFLHAIDGYPYHGGGTKSYDPDLDLDVIVGPQYNVEDPAIVDLNAEGFVEGDNIIISYTADLYYAGTYNPTNPNSTGWPLRIEDNLLWGGLLGVFSTSSVVLDIDADNRIPGSIPSGIWSIETPPTKWREDLQSISDKLALNGIIWYNGEEITDIPYDFLIAQFFSFEITIPRNARFLFLCCIDDVYYDNLGEIKVTLEKDSDHDGLPDTWEQNGIDIDEDGTVDLDLPMLGADWEHKDIFVEIDYMTTHMPNQAALTDVIDAFADSPVTNPDNVNGINLHVIVDEEIPFKEVLTDFDEFYSLKSTYFGLANERLDSKMIEAKKQVFRYALYVHKIWINPPDYDCPGIAEGIACNDFILAFGAFSDGTGIRKNQAAVFMHELGHSLGLRHGGGESTNYKPNYLSIMNYRFQYDSLLPTRPLDYSRKALRTINENNLDERAGIGVATKTVWYGYWAVPPVFYVSAGNMPIDWDADGNLTAALLLDLTDHPNAPLEAFKALKGHDDWSNLVYRFRGTALFQRSATPDDYHIELTNKEIEQMIEDAKNIIEVPTPASYEPTDGVEIPVSALGTFLRAEPFTGSPPDGSDVEGPAIVDLAGEGFREGDSITISYSGKVYYAAFWDNGDLGETYSAEGLYLIGLFSASEDLNPIDDLNRVPGAIDYGEDIITEPTYFQQYQTDIPEDFRIEPHSGATIQIPEGAKYLFISFADGFYPDNVGTINVSIQSSSQAAIPVELIIIAVIVLIALLLIFFLLGKRKKKKADNEQKL